MSQPRIPHVQRNAWTFIALAVLAATAVVPVAAGTTGASNAATGTLSLRATLSMQSLRGSFCPAGTAETVECFKRTGSGVVSGLGSVSQSYLYIVDTSRPNCVAGDVWILGMSARFTIAGKGEIDLAVEPVGQCLTPAAGLAPPARGFTVTGGTGSYAGASGSGTVKHIASQTDTGSAGKDTWVGQFVGSGLEFDVTKPTLTGAVARTVQAPRGAKTARVSFIVTARDDVDGSRPVVCRPPSGSRFKLGRTPVTCSATDKSGNTATARFVVTVKPRS